MSKRGREGGGKSRDVMGLGRTWALTWRKVGALGGYGQRRDGT